ncbi:MAG: O-antigen ligase family protein [Phycisphaerales bacterium]|nr:O-antigen ligase family protein [Phycisphaerales bacterium]
MKNNKLYLLLNRYQAEIAVVLTLGMVYGFLWGRAILSMSMLLFSINAMWKTPPRLWIKNKWWLWGLSWTMIYLISYFWSSDIPYWAERVQVKIPFLFFPLAFACLAPFSEKLLRYLCIGIILLVAGGCIYSLSFYFFDTEKILNGYRFSLVMPTPAYKDHIRFSIFVSWSIIWCFFLFRKMNTVPQKIIVLAAILFFSAYVHILAVRSGILVLYSFAILYIFYLLLKKRWQYAGVLLLSFASSVFIAYQKVPSFQHKCMYVKYTFEEYQKGNKSANFSDLGRLISYELAAKILYEHPLIGVGAGDIRTEMKKKYEQFSPKTKPEQRIVPHNQIIVVTLAGGVLSLGFFLIWLFYPLTQIKRTRSGFYVFAVWVALLTTMLVEPMLELQFGVFVYLFCFLWTQKASEVATTPSIN